ncbi:hypothetical protein C5167_046722 [Papaver somniferum]|uniref:Uncharacterized protein n=1 Tax=Papaver somniferum TaxID=3469 RepID=A0A4Y7LG75_PAPSO|nr:hypothetical protein C5167_046722 [Papaver somniferum]
MEILILGIACGGYLIFLTSISGIVSEKCCLIGGIGVEDMLRSPEKTAEVSLTKRKSGKARIRKLIAEAMSKHDHHKHRTKAHHSRLWRTD